MERDFFLDFFYKMFKFLNKIKKTNIQNSFFLIPKHSNFFSIIKESNSTQPHNNNWIKNISLSQNALNEKIINYKENSINYMTTSEKKEDTQNLAYALCSPSHVLFF